MFGDTELAFLALLAFRRPWITLYEPATRASFDDAFQYWFGNFIRIAHGATVRLG